jgi:hypothetical protein
VKKVFIFALVLGLLAGLLAVVGCGSDTTTVKTPEGEVTVTEEGGEMTFEGEDGDVTYRTTEEEPSEEELGAPIYPGAEYVEGSGAKQSASGEEGSMAVTAAEYTTDDDYEEVVAWYKDELGSPTYEGVGGEEEATWLTTKGQESVQVTVIGEDGEVTINIVSTTGYVNQ